MATSPGRTWAMADEPLGDSDASYRESMAILENYHWEEELSGVLSRPSDYALSRNRFRWDWFSIDGMEKGLLGERSKVHGQEKGRGHVMKDHAASRSTYTGGARFTVIDCFRRCISSLAAGFLEREPQNTQHWLLAGQDSSTGDYDACLNSLEGNRNIDGENGSHISEVSTAPLEASLEVLGLMNQRYAEVIISPIYWPVIARKMLSEVSPSDDTSYGSSSESIALLLEKAILNWNAAPRYIGLYPHSADPPIHITEIAEYPHQPSSKHKNSTNSISFARPARSHTSSHHRHYHLRNLRGAHATPKITESFLTSVLEAIKALGSIILTAILRVPLIGRIYKKVVPTRYRTRLNKDLKTRNTLSKDLGTTVYIMESNPPIVRSNEPDLDFREWLIDDIYFDTRTDNSAISTFPVEGLQSILSPSPSPSPSPALDPMPNFPEEMAGIDITYVPDFFPPSHLYNTEPSQYLTPPTEFPSHLEFAYPTELTEYSQLGNNLASYGPAIVFGQSEEFLNGAETLPPPYIAYDTTSEPDWSFINFSGSSTPPSLEQGNYNMEVSYRGPDPGSLSTPSSGTEGLETPTTTPAYSPVSVASSLQQQLSSRKYTCEHESCGHKEFDRPCDLNKHLKTHNKNLLCDFEPNGKCRERFSTEKDRKRHKDTKHEKKRPFTCHICLRAGTDRKFSRMDNFRVHKRKVHGEV